jgi:hypothetical protein
MNQGLEQAFRAAIYRVLLPGGDLLLKVDAPSPALATVLNVHGAASMAVLTAFNPQGQLRDKQLNCQAQQQMRRNLIEAGFQVLPGRNEDPTGQWPMEESFLVLGIPLSSAHLFAEHYDQAAFLWADATDATPRMYRPTPPDA